MLVVSRAPNESIVLRIKDPNTGKWRVVAKIFALKGSKESRVRLGIDADRDEVIVHRGEVDARIYDSSDVQVRFKNG